ncbi:MAG: methyltransferase domain-containing protein [Acidobacteriota bacterium]
MDATWDMRYPLGACCPPVGDRAGTVAELEAVELQGSRSPRMNTLRTIKRAGARVASTLGVLPRLTDLFLYAKSRPWRHQNAGDAGGATLPPPILRSSSTGTTDVRWFLESGQLGAEVVRSALCDQAFETARILDFGCGCGRVARHVAGPGFVGVDWNAAAIRWCGNHLPGRFVVGGLEPPLALDDGARFELIYAFSVFTHMPRELQIDWLRELTSRLDPSGTLLISTHGQAFVGDLSPDERALYDAGELVVREPVAAGTNVCAAYHPPESLAALLPAGWTIQQHVPEGALGNPPQDLWVLGR